MPLSSFLRGACSSWLRSPSLELVIGNEAADADSCVSALTYGHLLHARRRAGGGAHVLPVISCSRGDLWLRREAVHMLELCLAPPSEPACGLADLVCLDELLAQLPFLKALAAAGELAITLVDHNELTGALAEAGLGSCVREIVDHHADTGAHAHVAGSQRQVSFDPVLRKGVGSACTLVAEALFAEDAQRTAAVTAAGEKAGGCEEPQMERLVSPAVARLLLSVILLDTSCLSAHAAKATPQDHAMAAALHEVAGGASALCLE